MMPIVFLLLLFLFLQSSPPAAPPGNYYPHADYVPPPAPALIPTSALPATSTWRPTRPPSVFRGTPPTPTVTPPAPTPPASDPFQRFDSASLLNRLRAADAATSPDVLTSALTPFHRGV